MAIQPAKEEIMHMLRIVKDVRGYILNAQDGEIGIGHDEDFIVDLDTLYDFYGCPYYLSR
jgi:hypothetical protein